ncbi:MAG: periplasmic heavy metal sensor [Cytophagales bacterium]|nr:periplasmic heavy metal sensor [Cytophagales bacterium]
MNDKQKWYWLWAAIGLLLCLNLATLGWVAFNTKQPRRANSPGADAYLAQLLKFDPEQRSRYQQYRREMRTAVQPHEDSLRALRRKLFGRLRQPPGSEANVDALVHGIERQHGEITRLRFRHWQQVRALCSPGLQAQFDRCTNRLVETMNSPREPDQRERLRNPF